MWFPLIMENGPDITSRSRPYVEQLKIELLEIDTLLDNVSQMP